MYDVVDVTVFIIMMQVFIIGRVWLCFLVTVSTGNQVFSLCFIRIVACYRSVKVAQWLSVCEALLSISDDFTAIFKCCFVVFRKSIYNVPMYCVFYHLTTWQVSTSFCNNAYDHINTVRVKYIHVQV